MTDDENLTPLQRAARAHAERSRREQGLPPKITDPQALAFIAHMLTSPTPRRR